MGNSMSNAPKKRTTSRIVVPKKKATTKVIKKDSAIARIKEKNAESFSAIKDICHELSTGDPLERMLTKSLAICASTINADIMIVFTVNETGTQFQPAQALGINPEQLTAISIKKGQDLSELCDHNGQKIFEENPALLFINEKSKSLGLERALCVPLVYQNRIIGALIGTKREEGATFSATDNNFASSVAAMLALAFNSAIPRQDIMARERMERALQYAHSLQRCFTPNNIPEVKGYNITIKRNSSLDLGGDFYDVLQLPQHRIVVAIGKTSGKGVDAGLNISRTVMELRGILAEGRGPGKTLSKLNRVLSEQRRSGFLVNLALIEIDTIKHKLKYSGAGNIRLYLGCPKDKTIKHLEKKSATPMGILSEWEYEELSMKICSGGSLLAHTDGIANCVDENGEALSQLSLEGCIFQGLQDKKPVAEILMECLKAHSCTPIFQDDVTLLSVERKR